MSNVFGRNSRTELPTVASGEGVYLFDKNGKLYLDGSGGAAVSCLGHSNSRVRSALKNQLEKLAFAHTGFFTSEPAELLAEQLITKAPNGIEKVYLVSGGSEAVEAALKLARQYFLEIGQPQRNRIIARRQSFHGNTLGALAVGGNVWRRHQFAPLLIETSHISPCFAYRGQEPEETIEQYSLRTANELEEEITRLGSDNVMAFIAEPVVGATLGAVPPTPGYFGHIRKICDQHGILFIADEIMCGTGRTGSLFAIDQESVTPDIITMAKGLGAGYQPLGAMLCQKFIHDAIAEGSGFFQHGHTYHGHSLAAAAGIAVLQEMDKEELVEQVKQTGEYLHSALSLEFGQHPHIGDIRGRGLFMGLEFVADRETKKSLDPNLNIAGKLKAAAMSEGLICYPMQGTIDGTRGDHVLLAPAYIITKAQVDELVEKLARAIDRVFGNAPG